MCGAGARGCRKRGRSDMGFRTREEEKFDVAAGEIGPDVAGFVVVNVLEVPGLGY